jgi:hypothetical protein
MTGSHDADLGPAGPRIAWRLLRGLVDDVLEATGTLGTDLDALLVWAVLACESRAPAPHAPSSPAPGGRAAPRAVPARDLARLTGIPRETVRRKLLALEAAGCAERVVHGWVATTRDAPGLHRLADATMRRLRGTWEDVEAARRDGRAPGADVP